MEINQLKDVASQVRRDIIRMVHACQSGHPGGSLGATDIVTALYFDQMQINPENFRMDAAGEDAFFLSNGHISPMLYSILARRGYFPVAELATFRRLGTRLQGHPTTAEGLPGIRVASGSLGQGLSVAVGLAEALQNLENIWAHFTLMTLQNISIAVIPGELFSTLGLPLKKEGIEIFGYGNGYYLYLADKASYDQMVYEAISSPFEKGVGEFLTEEIKKANGK